MGVCASSTEYDEYRIQAGIEDTNVELPTVGDTSLNGPTVGGGCLNGVEDDTNVVIRHYDSEGSTSSLSDRVSTKEEWGYGEDNGPSTWKIKYSDCDGYHQSPINVQPRKAVDDHFKVDSETMINVFGSSHDLLAKTIPNASEFTFAYRNAPGICTNDGRNVTIVLMEAGNIRIFNDEPFALIQFHFHMPSEHYLDGKQYPLEMQLIHQQEDSGELAIVSLLFKDGDADPFLHDLMFGRPSPKFKQSYRISTVNWNLLSSERQNFLHYEGSLTQPPCSEGIAWFVNTDILPCSHEQLMWLRKSIPFNNNRPVQRLNGRTLRTCKGVDQSNLVE